MRLGIDFGTTHTVVAVCDRGNYPVLGFTGPSGEPTETYPSIVATRGSELRFGLDAEACLDDPAWLVVRSFKRLLSEPGLALDTVVRIGSRDVTLADLLSGFLSALRRDIIERSNLPIPPERHDRVEAVVATPAHARSPQRFITLEAFRRAQFDVVAVLDEPSASGIEYAHRYAGTLNSTRQRVLVYDLGGGTFDASVVDMAGADHRVIATEGVARLGGDDFDQCLLELVLDRLEEPARTITGQRLEALRQACREQKERLHPNSRRLFVEFEGESVQIPVDEYYAAVEPLVARTLEATERAMASAGVSQADLSGAYVVGGGSSLPTIGRALRGVFGRRYHRSPYPSASAAIGLAVAHDDDSPYRLRGRFARRFGVFREMDGGVAVSFDEIFGAQHSIGPAPGESREVVRRYRASHNIGHFRFVECDRVDPNGSPQGDLSMTAELRFPFDPALQDESADEPPRQSVVRFPSDGPLIEEHYSIGRAGDVELEIVSLETGYRRHYTLGAMSLAE